MLEPPEGDAFSSLEGRVEERIYLGDHLRCRMSVAGNEEFVVKIPNDSGHRRLEVGITPRVGWRTAECRALDA